ncbi:MAG: ProQ/FINO family protein [Rhodoferax sp.]|nr:ProQ/FINO family protein [Rhodoferax sp.]
MTEPLPISTEPVVTTEPAVSPAAIPKRPAKPDVFPVLEKMAELYPQLFGAVFLPLKRGIFQDLQDAHPDVFERDSLKAALSLHTRSTRYLTAVASGEQRHDLSGQPVEAMAPEHVHHALLEVFRRRQTRSKEDLRPKLIARIVQACEASGLTPAAYAERVRSRDEAANAVLDEAMVELEARAAKTQALLQAFQASGKTVDEFADMYGMDPRSVSRMLARAPASQA